MVVRGEEVVQSGMRCRDLLAGCSAQRWLLQQRSGVRAQSLGFFVTFYGTEMPGLVLPIFCWLAAFVLVVVLLLLL